MALNTGNSLMNVLFTVSMLSGGRCGMKYLSAQNTPKSSSRQAAINAKGQRYATNTDSEFAGELDRSAGIIGGGRSGWELCYRAISERRAF